MPDSGGYQSRIRSDRPRLHEPVLVPPASREGQYDSLREQVKTVRLPRHEARRTRLLDHLRCRLNRPRVVNGYCVVCGESVPPSGEREAQR